MKVFYVMVLVLVTGAVPSHGRTESEGTVFNKTQPHESYEIINNVTVNSSKVVTYGDSYLAMSWPLTYCYTTPCFRNAPSHFIVHGLWPQPKFGGRIDCGFRGIYGQYQLFSRPRLDPSLVDGLNTYWPDLTTSEDNNQCFWAKEYAKHGSCTFNDQNKYFAHTLFLRKELGDLISRIKGGPTINGPIIIPGNYYRPSDIAGAVRRFISKVPMLKCERVRNYLYLSEIRFCTGPNGNPFSDCKFISDCGNGRVYLPGP